MIVLANIALACCNVTEMFPTQAEWINAVSVSGVSGYLILKEVNSIVENLGRANPELASLPFFNRMKSNQEILAKHAERAEQED